MTNDDDALWLSVKADYEDSNLTLKQIAAKHGVSMDGINRRRNKHSWTPRINSKHVRQRAKAKQEKQLSTESNLSVPPKHWPRNYEDMLTWAWDQLGRQLNQTEQYFAERDDAQMSSSAADRERDARTLASITRTLEKLAELRTLFEKQEQEVERARLAKHVDYRALLERRLAKLSAASAA